MKRSLLSLFFILLLINCRKPETCMDIANPECTNYDPCFGAYQADAEFGFFDRRLSGAGDTIYYFEMTDTIYNSNWATGKIYFKAKSGMDSYSWKVGLDPREFTDSLFFLSFDPEPGLIDVTLTVTHDTNLECFPNGKVIDTKTKSFYIKLFEELTELPAIGIFRGYDIDLPDSLYTIEVTADGVLGLPPYCERYYGIPALVSQQEFVFDHSQLYLCGRPIGGGKRGHDDPELVIDYVITNEFGRRESKQFRGVKQE